MTNTSPFKSNACHGKECREIKSDNSILALLARCKQRRAEHITANSKVRFEKHANLPEIGSAAIRA